MDKNINTQQKTEEKIEKNVSIIQNETRLDFITVALTVLTLSLTITGTVLGIWGAKTLADAEEFIHKKAIQASNQAKKQAKQETAKFVNELGEQSRNALRDYLAIFNSVLLDNINETQQKSDTVTFEDSELDGKITTLKSSLKEKVTGTIDKITIDKLWKQHKKDYSTLKELVLTHKDLGSKILFPSDIINFVTKGLSLVQMSKNYINEEEVKNKIKYLKSFTALNSYETQYIEGIKKTGKGLIKNNFYKTKALIYWELKEKVEALKILSQVISFRIKKNSLNLYFSWSREVIFQVPSVQDKENIEQKLHQYLRQYIILNSYEKNDIIDFFSLKQVNLELTNRFPSLKNYINNAQSSLLLTFNSLKAND